MVKGISVIIPNYNGIALLPITLPTVQTALDTSGKPFEIIIVDDCSTDGSVAYLEHAYPAVKIIRNEVNSGFSVSVNKGVRAAVHDKVLLLNSDVKLTPGYFEHQYRYFDKTDTFGVMGRIVGWDDDVIQDGAKYPYFHGAKIKTSGNYLLKDESLMREGLYTIYLSGANAFIDREKFLAIGGFNEMFSPFYSEDYELSLRAWRLGYTCWFDYNSVCRHKVSHTIKSANRKKEIKVVYNRNKMFLHALHLSGWQRFLWFLQLTAECLVRLLLLQFYFVKAYCLYLAAFGTIKNYRKQFLQLATAKQYNRSVSSVYSFLTGNIKNQETITF